MYSEKFRAQRRCTALRKDGQPCRAYALWGAHVCLAHSDRQHRGPREQARHPAPRRPPACRCGAYAWPHRIGSGLCRYPDPPLGRCRTLAGTRGTVKLRGKAAAFRRLMKQRGLWP